MNGNTYDISSLKRVTKKFLDVSRCIRAKQRQRNVQKKCAACAKLILLVRPTVVFHRFPALHAFAAQHYTIFNILFQQTINIVESFAFSPG